MLGLALGWYGYRVYRGRYGLKISGISPAQVDKAYIQKVGMFGGVLITSVGALLTASFLYIGLAQDRENGLPIFLLVPMIVMALILVYVGIRILIGKQSD